MGHNAALLGTILRIRLSEFIFMLLFTWWLIKLLFRLAFILNILSGSEILFCCIFVTLMVFSPVFLKIMVWTAEFILIYSWILVLNCLWMRSSNVSQIFKWVVLLYKLFLLRRFVSISVLSSFVIIFVVCWFVSVQVLLVIRNFPIFLMDSRHICIFSLLSRLKLIFFIFLEFVG